MHLRSASCRRCGKLEASQTNQPSSSSDGLPAAIDFTGWARPVVLLLVSAVVRVVEDSYLGQVDLTKATKNTANQDVMLQTIVIRLQLSQGNDGFKAVVGFMESCQRIDKESVAILVLSSGEFPWFQLFCAKWDRCLNAFGMFH